MYPLLSFCNTPNLKTDFVHLHTHSHYSLLSALGSPGEIAKKAKEIGMKACAITDTANMHSAAEFYMECKKQEIKSILGVQAYLSPRSRFDKEPMDAKSFEVVLLAKNNTGYENLLCLMTEAHMNGFFHHPRIDWDLLQKHSKGLICLSGGLQGEIPQSIINGNTKEKTEEIIKRYQKVFGDDFYLELQRHPNEPNLDTAEKAIVEFGKEKNIPLVATNNSHYISPEDAEAHDILLCAKNNAQKKDPGRFTMLGGDYSLRSSEEMCKLFHDLPEACENTVKIAEMCDVKLTFGEYLLPSFPVPEGETIESYLLKMCEEGVEKRYGFDPKHPKNETEEKIVERMKYELEIINSMGFPAYFFDCGRFCSMGKKAQYTGGTGSRKRGGFAGFVCPLPSRISIRFDTTCCLSDF
jgi:DNA polymerase-3 subunit alpha